MLPVHLFVSFIPVTPKIKMSHKVTLVSNDAHKFEVEDDVACMSLTVKNILEDSGAEEDIVPLTNVSGTVLSKVIEYCRYHLEAKKIVDEKPAKTDEDIEEWEAEFIKVDQIMLFDIITAANYMNIGGLLDLGVKTLSQMIKGKTPDEVRKILNIHEAFTKEEEEEIRASNLWLEP